MKKLGIYVHIPFCMQKCYYCDFTSFTNKENFIDKYIKTLKLEIKNQSLKHKVEKLKVSTIYIGGGTPSFIESKYIKEIINEIKQDFKINIQETEITIEINPGTITKQKLQDYKEAGINRISIGLQAMQNRLLKQIGRIHTYEEFLETYNLVKKLGFENVNIDLMIGLPNQTLEDINETILNVIKLKPNHISVYSLIIEEETPIEKMIYNGKMTLPNEDIERQMYWNIKKELERSGYKHYEISNFAKIGYESKHNLDCWNQEEYFGFGLAAHSYYNNIRYSNTDSLEKYIENGQEGEKIVHEVQTKEDKEKEYMLLGLRKIDGVDITKFKDKFSENALYVFRKELEKLTKNELIEIDGNSIRLTNLGINLANLVWEEFV